MAQGKKTIPTLYGAPELYERVFPLDEEEVGFFASMIRRSGGGQFGILLDAGCGTGSVGRAVADRLGGHFVGVDASMEILRGGGDTSDLSRADVFALPFRDGAFDAVVSRLLSYGYALGAGTHDPAVAAMEIGRVLSVGGIAALEIPLAWRPERLVGVEERAEVAGEMSYRCRYLDVLGETAFGVVLDSEIVVEIGGAKWEIRAPMHIHTPDGARRWLAAGGLSVRAFHAPYDVATGTLEPPEDCLRSIVCAVRQ